MPVQDYLEVTGLSGTTTSAAFSGAFAITGFNVSAESVFDLTSSGFSLGRTDFGALQVSFQDLTGASAFLSKLTTGGALAQVSVVETDPTGAAEALRINLANTQVTDVEQTGDGFTVTLAYSRIGVITSNTATDGSPTAPDTFGYNAASGVLGAPPANAVPSGAVAAVSPTKFYLLIDGVTGDSKDAGHVGWFELSDFDVKMLNSLMSVGSGLAAGKAEAEPLQVTLSDSPGVTELLRALANGQLIDGARIEGVTGGSTPAVTYKLNLANVAVTQIEQSDGQQTTVDLAFGAFQLSTSGAPTVSWNFQSNSSTVFLPIIAPGTGETGTVHPTDFFLNIASIKGSSIDAQHPGSLEVTGFSFGVAAQVDMNSTSTGAGAGKPDFGEVEISFQNKTGLAGFLADLTTGRSLGDVTLVGSQPTATHSVDTYSLTLAHTTVTAVTDASDGGYTVSLAYTQFGVVTTPLQANGTPGAPVSFGYDIATHTVGPAPTPVAAPGGAIGPAPAEKFYLLIDGVNGGSTDAGHVGWFELTTYDLEALNQVLTGATSAGKASAQPLDVSLEGSTGVTQLLAKLAAGAVISGARIEGVTGGPGPAQAVYDLNLVNVAVSHVSQSEDGQADVSLFFGGFSLTTGAVSSDGSVTTSTPVTWNFATNAHDVTLPSIAPAPAAGGAVAAPTDYYFSVSGVRGDVIAHGFAGALDVKSFQFAAELPISSATGSATASGHPDFGPLTLTFGDETGLNTFLNDLVTGANVANASLVGVGPTQQETYRLNLADMTVTNVQQNPGGGYSVTLNYGQIGVVTHAADASGASLPAQQFGWSVTDQTAIAPPPNFTAPGGAPSVHPTSYYVLIDGLNGGSTDPGHEGWFKISSVDLEALTQLTGSLGAGPATAAPLTFEVEGASGLTDLLTQLASGRPLEGARIEGVSGGPHPTVVYTLNLVDVAVENVDVGEGGQYGVRLGFGAYTLTTVGQNSDGSTSAAQTTAWSFEKNSSQVTVLPIAPGPGNSEPPPPPPTSLALDVTADTGAVGDHLTTAHTLTVDGAAQAGATVKILDGTTVAGTGVADANGAFQISVTLADGTHSLTATATSSSGVTGAPSAPFTLTVDSTPPGAPTGLALDASTDTGAAGDGRTSATQLKIDGQAEAGSHVTLYDGQTAVGAAVADSSGAFQITTSALANGAHALTATATDAAGNLGPVSSGLAVTVETLSLAADAGGHAVVELPGVTGAATSDGATATLAFTDADSAATHSVQLAAPAFVWSGGASLPPAVLAALSTGLTSATLTESAGGGSVAVSLQAPDSAFDFLAAGETLTVTSLVTVTGSSGGLDQQPVTFTVTGANDAPIVTAGVAAHSLSEIAGATGVAAPDFTSATLSFTDADLTDQHTVSVAGAPTLVWSGGSFVPPTLAGAFNGAVTASLSEAAGSGVVTATFSEADAAFDFLGQGETLTLTYDVTVSDSHGASATQPVSFVVTGSNDAPVITGGSAAATLAERAATLGSAALDQASGAITAHDPDLNDRPSVALGAPTVVAHGSDGASFALTTAQATAFAAGFQATAPAGGANEATLAWSYAVEDRALDFLGAGESVTVTATAQIDDHHGGTLSQPITITLQGANDAPTAAADAASVQRGGALAVDKAHGVLANDRDPDLHDVLQVTAVDGQAAGGAITGAYGSLTLKADGSYSYLASKNAALPSSGVGQDVFTYQVSDGHGGVATQSLAVTVYAGGGGTSYLAGVPGVTNLSGGNGKGVLDAGAGTHVLQGGNGADVLVAGFGADTMSGGNGPDVFVFGHSGFGASVITDFAASDSIQLDHHLFANFADVLNHAVQVGRDVVIALDAQDTITLQGVTLASLRSSEFLFV